MSKARQLADLLDSNGDVVVGALDNAPDPDLTPYATTTYVDTEIGNVDLSTRVATSGDSMTGNLSFDDNDKAIFGAGSDLQIYHNGTNNRIESAQQLNIEAASGDVVIRGTDNIYLQGSTSNETFLKADEDGAVTLYHNNSSKLATTSSGISVTGDLSVSGSIAGAGKVLQVVQGTDAVTGTYSANSETRAVGATINLSSTSSKVLVIANIHISEGSGDVHTFLRRDTGSGRDKIAYGTKTNSNGTQAYGGTSTGRIAWDVQTANVTFLDSPSLTGNVGYYFSALSTNGSIGYNRQLNGNQNISNDNFTLASIVLMEIAP